MPEKNEKQLEWRKRFMEMISFESEKEKTK